MESQLLKNEDSQGTREGRIHVAAILLAQQTPVCERPKNNLLGRIVGVPSLYKRLGTVHQEAGMGVRRPDERKAFVNTGRLIGT